MRLSEWRAAAPHRDAAGPKVSAVVDPILEALGSGPDPHAWFVWGEDAANRYAILVPTEAGIIVAFVRPIVPGEDPRASAKLVRWSRVAIGELGVEAQAGHRLLSFQVEQQVLRGVDAEADRVAEFALRVIAAVDGRPLPPAAETPRRRRTSAWGAATTGRAGAKGSSRTAGTSGRKAPGSGASSPSTGTAAASTGKAAASTAKATPADGSPRAGARSRAGRASGS